VYKISVAVGFFTVWDRTNTRRMWRTDTFTFLHYHVGLAWVWLHLKAEAAANVVNRDSLLIKLC